MGKNVAIVLFGVAVITMICFTGLVSLNAVAEETTWTRIVSLTIDSDIYSFGLNITGSYYVEELNKLGLDISLRLLYSTSSEPVFVTLTLRIGDLELASTALGVLSTENPSAFTHLSAQLPPHVVEKISGESQAVFASLELVALRGTSMAKTEISIPIVVSKTEPILAIKAVFDDGFPYTLAFLGETTARRIIVSVTNYGPLDVRELRLSVLLDGKLVAMKSIAKILKAKETKTTEILVPIPFTKGIHTVVVKAEATIGAKHLEAYNSLLMFVVERPRLYIMPINKTLFIEGEKACFKLLASNTPYGITNASIGLEYSPSNRGKLLWSMVLMKPVSGEKIEEIFCWSPPLLETTSKTKLLVRGVLIINYMGREIQVTSKPIEITIVPLNLAALHQGLILELVPSEAYLGSKIIASLTLTPGLPGCFKSYVEKFDTLSKTWTIIASVNICNGKGEVEIPSESLGVGKSWLRARIELNGISIISGLATVTILNKPKLIVQVPEIVRPGEAFRVIARVEPPPPSFLVSFRPSWSTMVVNVTGSEGYAEVTLFAPTMPGKYTINILAIVREIIIETNKSIDVENITLSLKVVPAKVESKGKVEIEAYLSPPLNDTVEILVLKKGRMISKYSIELKTGRGSLAIEAPSEPGIYTIRASSKVTGVEATAQLEVIRIKRKILLKLLNTTVEPQKEVKAVIVFEPLLEAPTTVTIVVGSPSGVWRTVVSSLASGKSIEVSFIAPSIPGEYKVKAILPQYNLSSNIVTLIVEERTRQVIPAEMFVIIMGAIIAAIAGISFRALRRRR